MPEFDERLDELQKRLDALLKWQDSAYREINQLKNEISSLRKIQQQNFSPPQNQPPQPENKSVYVPLNQNVNQQGIPPKTNRPPIGQEDKTSNQPPIFNAQPAKQFERSNFERFIGENLFSIVGILVLIIGIAIIGKYAIDQNWITPLMRIVVGYVFGFGLLGFAFKLKEKYLSFSALLLSGAMAIMYFITFFAHSLYDIFNQTIAFVLMLVFTVFTVAAAINFNRQVIANIGLVGAYAIPFLLSNDSGNITFLFTYVAIINVGILAISIRKYWKSLFYLSFIFTWLIFSGWYAFRFQSAEHFNLAFLFLSINFFTFYLTFLAYKLVSHESVAIENISLILANSFIFYGIGYTLLESREGFETYLGLFTIGNAAIHFVFASVISRLKLVSSDLVYLLSALVLIFITIAIPVQLDGQIVTLIWIAEAAIVFWIGRTKQLPLFEIYSLPVMILSLLSLIYDWEIYYRFLSSGQIAENIHPFFNGTFLTSILFAVAFTFIFAVNRDKNHKSSLNEDFAKILGALVAAIGLAVLYNGIRMEIGDYFQLKYLLSAKPNPAYSDYFSNTYNYDLKIFSFLWQLNFTMFFISIMAFVNVRKFKNQVLSFTTIFLTLFSLMIFLTAGLYLLGDLRNTFLRNDSTAVFQPDYFHILIRYICYVFVSGLLFTFYQTIKQDYLPEAISKLRFIFDIVFYVTLLFILTSELINWTEIFGYRDSFKLVTSIFWGIYAVGLIVLGIYQKKAYLRFGAIILFTITLIKLFLYDIAELGTISKTVVFVSLGILLLIASFLYNKYKTLIFEN